MKNFIQELQWRGMIQDMMPETEQHLSESVHLKGGDLNLFVHKYYL